MARACDKVENLTIGPGLTGKNSTNIAISADSPKVVVLEVQDDMLRCRWWNTTNKTAGTVDVFVAKPPLLQRTPYDGVTENGVTYAYSTSTQRTATPGGTQTVTPPWNLPDTTVTPNYPGDVVEVAYDPSTGLTDPNNNPVVWRDTNDGGRTWQGLAGFFPVQLTNDGGINGTNTTVATYTYTLKSLNGMTTLGTTKPQIMPRTVGAVTVRPSGSIGAAYMDASNVIQLWNAGEPYGVDATCST
jgi:uncharacterized protein YodC (DUF2158 family)